MSYNPLLLKEILFSSYHFLRVKFEFLRLLFLIMLIYYKAQLENIVLH